MNQANPIIPSSPSLYALQVAHQQGYRPELSVTWEEDVAAWQTRFTSVTDSTDTIDYLFNTKEEGEALLLEYLDAPEIPEIEDDSAQAGQLMNEEEEGEY